MRHAHTFVQGPREEEEESHGTSQISSKGNGLKPNRRTGPPPHPYYTIVLTTAMSKEAVEMLIAVTEKRVEIKTAMKAKWMQSMDGLERNGETVFTRRSPISSVATSSKK